MPKASGLVGLVSELANNFGAVSFFYQFAVAIMVLAYLFAGLLGLVFLKKIFKKKKKNWSTFGQLPWPHIKAQAPGHGAPLLAGSIQLLRNAGRFLSANVRAPIQSTTKRTAATLMFNGATVIRDLQVLINPKT